MHHRTTRWNAAGPSATAATASASPNCTPTVPTSRMVEARLADAIAPRGARILNAVAAWAGSARRYVPVDTTRTGSTWMRSCWTRRHAPTPSCRPSSPASMRPPRDRLPHEGFPSYDLVVCVGNVMILGEEGGERNVLGHMRDLLAPEGRLLVGFHTDATPPDSQEYAVDEFAADAEDAGLRIDARFGTYELHPYDPRGNYAVHLLSRA